MHKIPNDLTFRIIDRKRTFILYNNNMNRLVIIQYIGIKKKYHRVVKKNLFTSHKNQIEQNKTKARKQLLLLILQLQNKFK